MADVDGRERDGWKHDDDGWYDDGWTSDAADADADAPNPYRTLPARVTADDTVGETDVSVPPFDPAGDPNREIANRWGAGIAGL
jgi:hypothetical protein